MQLSQVAHSSKMQQSPKVLVTHSPIMWRQVRSKLRCVKTHMWTKAHFCKGEDYRVECLIFISSQEKEKGVLNIDLIAGGNVKNEYMLAFFVFKSEMYWQFLVCMSDNFLVQLDAQHISVFIFASGPARLGELASSAFIFSFLPHQPGNVGRWCLIPM